MLLKTLYYIMFMFMLNLKKNDYDGMLFALIKNKTSGKFLCLLIMVPPV